jgi:type II secretory pathway pseudopilin PulG
MRKNNGFTLIELILYVGISSFILLVTFLFVSQILEARIKAQAIAEVEQQGDWAVEIITQAIKNSKSPINLPTTSGTANILSLTMDNVVKNPTDFSLSNGVITISEAGGQSVSLTNSNVVVSGLNFQNLSRTGTAGNIKFSFVISYKNQGQIRHEFNYSKTFYGTSSVRY